MKLADTAPTAHILGRLADRGVNTIAEARLLMTAAARPGSTMTELAGFLEFPMSTVSRCVFQLAELGLISYETKAGDRRAKVVRALVKDL
jgi:DNA-binding MarR family transcriptional regulator